MEGRVKQFLWVREFKPSSKKANDQKTSLKIRKNCSDEGKVFKFFDIKSTFGQIKNVLNFHRIMQFSIKHFEETVTRTEQ